MTSLTPEHRAFLEPYGPAITKLVIAARKLVLEEAPSAVELIYDAYSAVSAGYSFTGRPSECFLYVAAYTKGVNMGFWAGTSLPDPDGLLEGTGKRSRRRQAPRSAHPHPRRHRNRRSPRRRGAETRERCPCHLPNKAAAATLTRTMLPSPNVAHRVGRLALRNGLDAVRSARPSSHFRSGVGQTQRREL
jgi:hypothetical protein